MRLIYFQADPALFPQGVKLVEQAVVAGEPDAYYYLARCYAWEDGNVEGDERKAKELYKKGIALGSDLCVLGADRMGALNEEMKTVMVRSLRESYDAVLKMAEAGDPMAQYTVGLFYFWGDMLFRFQKPSKGEFDRCEKENAQVALKWFCRSAEQGCIPAFRNAFNGMRGGINSIPKDPKEALRWAESVKDKVDMRDYYYRVPAPEGLWKRQPLVPHRHGSGGFLLHRLPGPGIPGGGQGPAHGREGGAAPVRTGGGERK